MSIAELHGKISRTGINLHDKLEDLLTSDVFSAFKYSNSNNIFLEYINKSVNINGTTLQIKNIEKISFDFWPRLNSCEPDLLINIKSNIEDITILIEAKYLSGKSSEILSEDDLKIATTPKDQLAREYNDLINLDLKSKKYLIYITTHRFFPTENIKESNLEILSVLKKKSDNDIFWNNWFNLSSILLNTDLTKLYYSDNLIYEDLKKLLIRKGLKFFTGFRLKKNTLIYSDKVTEENNKRFKIKTNSMIIGFYKIQKLLYDFNIKPIKHISSFYEGEIK